MTARRIDKPEEIYVVVAKNDVPHPRWGLDKGGEIVLEIYTKQATLENARQIIKRFNGRLGECRIARLEFVE